jgi:hypothetical protein
VVSLLDMLEFSARDYIELTYQIGLHLGSTQQRKVDGQTAGTLMANLVSETSRLGLAVTKEQVTAMILEIVKQNPSRLSFSLDAKGLLRFAKVGTDDVGTDDYVFDPSRLAHYFETIYTTLKAELGTLLFKVIPRERANYSSSAWLKTSPVALKFPTSFQELDRAGTCYALGQPTSSVFHSMRALEPALAALAKPFNVSSAHDNWQNVIQQIEAAVRTLGGQAKSPQKIEDEKFFGGATSHLYFVKNAWRNHVAHTRDSYSDDEAAKVMQHSLEFIESLCPRLQE